MTAPKYPSYYALKMARLWRIPAFFLLMTVGAAAQRVEPAIKTDPVKGNPDDPAIWRNERRPEASRVYGTTKLAAPDGALIAFDLEGRIVQQITGLDRPNNVDVEEGFRLAGRRVDIAVVTERNKNALRVFAIDAGDGKLTDVSGGGLPVFESEPEERRKPMGVSLFRRKDGEIFAILSRKSGPSGAYLWQYRLADAGNGRVKAEKMREFGAFSGTGEIEAIAVDDELGFVYYSDEGAGIRKYRADPAHPEAAKELAIFGTQKYEGDREGLAILATGKGKGYIVSTDQIAAGSKFHFYPREGDQSGGPVRTVATGLESTDGLEIDARAFGPKFRRGLVAAMNNAQNNFWYFRLEEWLKAQ